MAMPWRIYNDIIHAYYAYTMARAQQSLSGVLNIYLQIAVQNNEDNPF